jgi:predicted transcriptional regulator
MLIQKTMVRKTNPDRKEILKAVSNAISSNGKATLKHLNEYLDYSRSLIGICIRMLFERGLIKKEKDINASGHPVTYVWVGNGA